MTPTDTLEAPAVLDKSTNKAGLPAIRLALSSASPRQANNPGEILVTYNPDDYPQLVGSRREFEGYKLLPGDSDTASGAIKIADYAGRAFRVDQLFCEVVRLPSGRSVRIIFCRAVSMDDPGVFLNVLPGSNEVYIAVE